MRVALSLVALLFAFTAEAQGIRRDRPDESIIVNANPGAALTSTTYASVKLGQPATVQTISFWAYAATNGAGNTTIRVTDGTSNCDLVIACGDITGSPPGSKSGTPTGTCSFSAGATLTLQATAGCAVTQASVRNITATGIRN